MDPPGGLGIARTVQVGIPAIEHIRKCSACPGVPDTSPCSGRGFCSDDVSARGRSTRAQTWEAVGFCAFCLPNFVDSCCWAVIFSMRGKHTNNGTRTTVYGDGTCNCSAPFSGERCEVGLCLPGHKPLDLHKNHQHKTNWPLQSLNKFKQVWARAQSLSSSAAAGTVATVRSLTTKTPACHKKTRRSQPSITPDFLQLLPTPQVCAPNCKL